MEFIGKGFAMFLSGGPIMYIILLCSLTAAAISMERLLYYRTLRPLPTEFMPEFKAALGELAYEKALQLCKKENSPAAAVAAIGIDCLKNAPERVENAMDCEALVVVGRLRKNIAHLSSIVTVAPLLGLLGTVIGMIDSFQVMNLKNGEPMAITGGVGEALVATAFGLFVAIFAMGAYSYFTHRQEKIIAGIEEVTAVIVRTAK